MKTTTLNTPTLICAALVRTVNELMNVNPRAWEMFQESKLGNDLFISDPDRADRIHKAAEDGCDGSTHAEHIEDFREYAKEHYGELRNASFNLDESVATDQEIFALDMEIEAAETALNADIDALELWHEKNGSLYQQVG